MSKALVIDCGTQGVRALIFDKSGKLLAKEKRSYEPYYSIKPGYAEQDPEFYFDEAIKCIKQIKNNYLEIFNEIEVVSVTTLRDTGVFLNQNKEVVRPSLLWLDQRSTKEFKPLKFTDVLLFKTIGMYDSMVNMREHTKVNWIKANEKSNWEKTKYYLLLSGYFHYRLTGNIVDSVSNQIGHIPFNYRKQKWEPSRFNYRWDVFGIDKKRLPPLVKSGEIIGNITKEISNVSGLKEGIPVVSAASDKGCETLGVGCVDNKTVSLSFGTTATIQTTSDKYLEPIRFMPSYPSALPNKYNPEVEVFRGYWMIKWFKSEFAQSEMNESKKLNISTETLLNRKLNDVPPGSYGLILQPFWTPGLKNPEAKGAIIGFSDTHKRAHFYRAIIEGINYGLMDGLDKIEKVTKVKVEKIFVSGGGAQSDVICQITADMFNIKVIRCETFETAGLGAAMCGFVGIDVYNTFDSAIKKMVHYEKTFIPNELNKKIYNDLFNKVYKKIYPKLKDLYSEIDEITMEEQV